MCSIPAHAQVKKVSIGQKKAHMMEIQVNGGTIDKKVDFAVALFEQVRAIQGIGFGF